MTTRIQVATYNVHKCQALDQRTSPERIAAVIAELDADVVALQELLDVQNGRPEFNQARQIDIKLRGYEWCFGENRRLHGGPYGNIDADARFIVLAREKPLRKRWRSYGTALSAERIASSPGFTPRLANSLAT
jgi:endonuclease/exonuclease/phosphatase family metal-dependent hydrolase